MSVSRSRQLGGTNLRSDRRQVDRPNKHAQTLESRLNVGCQSRTERLEERGSVWTAVSSAQLCSTSSGRPFDARMQICTAKAPPKPPHSKRFAPFRCTNRKLRLRFIERAALPLLLVPILSAAACGATNSESADDSLKLLPPYGEMPPGFWEQHGIAVILGALAFAAFVSFVVWYFLRPRPVEPLPPAAQARRTLNTLLNRPEDGASLSNVSQVLRRYIIAAFELPPGEPTTSEFCQTLAHNDKVGSDLSTAVAEFLRRCDERKFSPKTADEPLGAVARALELVAMGEKRLAQLRQEATQPVQTFAAHA